MTSDLVSELPAISMLSGFIEAAMKPAITVFRGVLGTIAANIITATPTQLIIGLTCVSPCETLG